MESQMVRPRGHSHEQDPYKAQDQHLAVEGEDEHQHEKKSVLKKVKAKAKKIKDTITKHGHGHNHDHDYHGHDGDHTPDDHDLDEDDDEDDAMVVDPEVHGAPIYESTTVMISATPVNTPLSSFSDRGISDTNFKETRDPSKTFVPGKQSRKVNLESPEGLQEDPDSPSGHSPSNYQTKVADPTGSGAEEIEITPLLHSFDRMNLEDTKSEPKPHIQNLTNFGSSTGSHDQFSPEPFPRHPHPTTRDADKAVSPKNVVASKLGYGEKDESITAGGHATTYDNKSASAKIAATVVEKLTPVYEKVAQAGTTVMSKMHGGTAAGGSEGRGPAVTGQQDKGVSVKGYLAEKLRPAAEDRALSEAISDALHTPRRRGPEEKRSSSAVSSIPMERVSESEEVTRRLGDDNRSEVDKGPYNSYVDMVKGTVGSWLGFGTGQDHSKASQGARGDNFEGKTEERRLEDSSN